MPHGDAEQISIFRSQIERRRFQDETLRILESILVAKDVKSSLVVRLSLKEFMRRESLRIICEIEGKSVEHKLSVLDFLVRAFALAGDVESCLALRYEALVLRELMSASTKWLQVSYREWMTFAKHSLDNGFYSNARKACENALSCYQINGMLDTNAHDLEVLNNIIRLKDVATALSASHSVQAQATEYLKKKMVGLSGDSLACKEALCLASTLFRDGTKKRNTRKLQDYQNIKPILTGPRAKHC